MRVRCAPVPLCCKPAKPTTRESTCIVIVAGAGGVVVVVAFNYSTLPPFQLHGRALFKCDPCQSYSFAVSESFVVSGSLCRG